MNFTEQFTESHVSKSVWLNYVQGFQGWGAGRTINGKFTKCDGLSGNHVPIFQALDAFVGMGRYLSDENIDRYIPRRQRDLCDSLRARCFRRKLDDGNDLHIREEFAKIVSRLKV